MMEPTAVESTGEKSWPRSVGRVGLAALGGALLTVLVLIVFYRAVGLSDIAPAVVLAGTDLQLASGQGAPTADGLEIRQPGPQQITSVQGSGHMVRAELYRQISWRVDGLEPGRELRLIWTTLAEPRTVREMVLPPAGPDGGALDLSAEPRWRGRIAVIGLVLRGAIERPLVVRRLELRPPVLGVGELAQLAFEEWTAFEDWSQRSINYTAGAPLDALFPPGLMVALWVGFSVALYALFDPPRRSGGRWWPYAVLFLLGWLVLDLRWQWDLSRRLERTEARFAGKEGDERQLAAADGDLYRFLRDVRRRLPERPARLFVVSADPGDTTSYQAGRTRYHLLPHNGFMGFALPPSAGVAREGDFVLILSPLSGVRYDRERQVLEWAGGQLAVELLHAATSGALFRVRGG